MRTVHPLKTGSKLILWRNRLEHLSKKDNQLGLIVLEKRWSIPVDENRLPLKNRFKLIFRQK